MNAWAFVIAAYALVGTAAGLLVVGSWLAMRRAEAAAAQPRR